jgi:hypothetical protein
VPWCPGALVPWCPGALVPWCPVIEKELGRTVSGLMRGDGISWEIGRIGGLGSVRDRK